MRISSYKHLSISALRSLKRNFSLSIASMSTLAASLFIVGVFFMVSLNINQGILGVESKIEAKIFLNDDITEVQKKDIEDTINKSEDVTSLKFESKTDALVNLRKQLGEKNKGILEALDADNPLPQSYIVKVKKPDMLTAVVASIEKKDGIYEIQDGRNIVKILSTITNTIRWAGVILFVIFISVSLFLIGNTIKLAVYSRRREIGIMKFIGATDWFIKVPFIIEGMIIGVVGALVASGMIYGGYSYIYVKYLTTLSSFMIFISPAYILYNIWIFIISGLIVGAIGSSIAIKKFLQV